MVAEYAKSSVSQLFETLVSAFLLPVELLSPRTDHLGVTRWASQQRHPGISCPSVSITCSCPAWNRLVHSTQTMSSLDVGKQGCRFGPQSSRQTLETNIYISSKYDLWLCLPRCLGDKSATLGNGHHFSWIKRSNPHATQSSEFHTRSATCELGIFAVFPTPFRGISPLEIVSVKSTSFTLFPQLAPETCNPHDKNIHINEATPVYQLTTLHKFNDHFKSNTSCIQSTPHDSEVTSQNRCVAVPASCLFVGHPHAWGHHCHKHYAPADSAETKMKLNVCQSLGSNQV